MVSYLVMINNCKRLLKKKSTYILVLLLPIILIVSCSLVERIGKKQIRIGIVGSDQYVQYIKEQLKEYKDVYYRTANEKIIKTDMIMGTYTYILNEADSQANQAVLLQNLKKSDVITEETSSSNSESASIQTNSQSNKELSVTERMLTLLLTVYMTVSVIYSVTYINEKKSGLLERVKLSGGSLKDYLTGYVLSNCTIIGIQLIVIIGVMPFLYDKFSISILTAVKIIAFMIIIINLFSMIITVISKSELMAGILGSSIAIVLAMLGGAIIPLDMMPKLIKTISIISPVKWLILLLR